MKVFAQTNIKNDLLVSSDGNDFSYASGLEAYALAVADAIRTLKGEIQLDLSLGIDYEGTIWTQSKRLQQWKQQVRNRIMQFPFVKSIKSFEAAVVDGKTVNYTLILKTDLGETELKN